MLDLMSPSRGVQRRPANADAVLLQGRVSSEVRAAVKDAATASGVSVSFYLDQLFKDMLATDGALPTVTPTRPQKETLIDTA